MASVSGIIRLKIGIRQSKVGDLVRIMRLALLAVAYVASVAAPVAADTPGPEVDRYGDALPPGAIQRLGTIRNRVIGESFVITPDGRSVVGIGWGRNVSVIDAKTGVVTAHYGLPVEDALCAKLFSDGKVALVIRQPRHGVNKGVWELWDIEQRKLIRQVGPKEVEVGIIFSWEPVLSPDGKTIVFEVSDINRFD